MSNPKFTGQCHKTRHPAGHSKYCLCGKIIACELVTNDPALFADHLNKHTPKPRAWYAHGMYDTPAWVLTAGKPWKAPRSNKPWEPKPFDVGDVVTWRDGDTIRTGQVWSRHWAQKTRWVVADSNAYEVNERDVIEMSVTEPELEFAS
jgi:hypothetical protein